ncbi:alpha-hydroxy-acid oxidizing protein [Pectobacteriaceae bacterium CE90]|nr:alpha-hydroxy-acid oxidizing protein [Pectobacteriaceae bacterium CE90]
MLRELFSLKTCVTLGADDMFLSNYGGRQLDSAFSPMETFSETRRLVDAPVLIDSGFCRMIKVLALGQIWYCWGV